jgi:poly(hydroxyalkanoate) granule-associated protein
MSASVAAFRSEHTMLKKTRAEAASASPPSAKDLSKSILDSSREIWLAGLGAFSRARGEGMRVFETLVKQGETLESSTRKMASATASAARDVAQSKAKEVHSAASGTWDRLEQVFEDRVARALRRLGVYSHDDVERLSQRVDALSEAVNTLVKATRATPAPAKRSGTKGKQARKAAKGTKPKPRKARKAARVTKATKAASTGETAQAEAQKTPR